VNQQPVTKKIGDSTSSIDEQGWSEFMD